ncbi:NADH-quinone oxidoreductase subunit C [Streptomyces yaanensis]|uniref:NADH-quinone oxidoreductase subunit C n=1 Tax=Streptomyces yaanensis TaxID=1142239 RepID=A0ABV7SJL5_9ACTN|nr:NADH-quinone oxidoreductase subunit C [Streptomyces sp. CGMCC 4.7035]WNB97129.1 NADH-quinone oxidoreductase subunit C [Streptomyces sp. CGMCC 4.7035]
MTAIGWLPAPAEDLFGPEATAEESYDVLTVDVPPTGWTAALRVARDDLGCTYFDWLSAVDEPGTGLRVSAHVVALSPVRRLLVRTTVPHEAPVLPSAVDVYAGAAWHERETHEMFGVTFEGHPALDHLLLPDGFEGHPLRKDFVLAARVAKAWPGAKEPGESDHGGPKRRQMLPPGVPDPNEWGPLKGQLPPAPARPARAAGRTAGDRPVRRTRTAAEGSTSQAPAAAASETPESPVPTRRARSVSEGSASQRGAAEGGAGAASPAGPRRARSASEGSASQRGAGTEPAASPAAPAAGPRRTRSASQGSASQRAGASAAEGTAPEPPVAPRSSDAPWHHARPAFDEADSAPEPPTEAEAEAKADAKADGKAEARAETRAETRAEDKAETRAEDKAETRAEDKAEAPLTQDEPPTHDDPSGGTR